MGAAASDPVASVFSVPIYEYKCPKGHVFEVFQRIDDPPPESCERCGEGPLQRVLHPVAVHFKGSGFYSTDYGRGARKKDASTDGDKPAKSDSGDKKDKPDKPAKVADS
jgi:putative FmdB family regulatory protein